MSFFFLYLSINSLTRAKFLKFLLHFIPFTFPQYFPPTGFGLSTKIKKDFVVFGCHKKCEENKYKGKCYKIFLPVLLR